jgi:hypothetical protein
MLALAPDPPPVSLHTPVSYVPYTVTAPAVVQGSGVRIRLPDGRELWLRCRVPVQGQWQCQFVAR